MKKNSNAFTIIKTLTMSEKRYFKIFSERHTIGSQNKYVTLFDALDQNEIEDDGIIKAHLKSKKINGDFLSADKNYLYNLILKSLNDFHDSKTINLELKEMLSSIEILFHKGLYKECLKLISKAENIANECENHALLIDVLMWKKKCSGYSLGLSAAVDVNQAIGSEVLSLKTLQKITDLYYESNVIQSSSEKYSTQQIQNSFKKILQNLELLTKGTTLSLSAKIYYHLIYANYYFSIDEKNKELAELQKLIDLINKSKSYAVENPLDYVSIYNRLLAIKKHFPKSDFFKDLNILNEFHTKVKIRQEVVLQRVFIHCNTHELEYYLINNESQRAIAKIKDIENGISKLNLEIEPYHLIYFYYLQIIALIFTGQFHKALKNVNNVLNEFELNARPQVYMRVELLNAIVHYELKNYSLVQTISKQVLKKNTSNNILLPFEEKILRTLIKCSGVSNLTIKEESANFQTLLNEMKTAEKSSNIGLIENYEKWINSKIKRKLVSEIYN